MPHLLTLGLFFPLLGFLILVAASQIISRRFTSLIACATVAVSFFCFLSFLGTPAQEITLFQWIALPGVHADFILRMDPLSQLMTLIITGVGFLIHLYSIGYTEYEQDYARYFAFLNFFIFAMLLLVLAGDLLLLFVGWEGVGLASYLLIGYWYERPQAARAATKAFVVNRIGDFGLLMGLLMTFSLFGSGNIQEIAQRAGEVLVAGSPAALMLVLFYFMGAMGKSAQLPLHVWLPDAMEGPTPVSALIHAATMVTAGVYLLARMNVVVLLAPAAMEIIALVGGVTALFASLCALGQVDLKRVLAYSTVSQLGLMFLACGLGAFYAALFHLTVHAFVKALLFLAAGNIVHKMHGITQMSKMGGLRKVFPKTFWLFFIGVLALSGVPPLAAFFSKEAILDAAHNSPLLFTLGLSASLLTAVYMTRAFTLTFFGEMLPDNLKVREAPAVMLAPVALLAVCSILGGFLGYAFLGQAPLETLLHPLFESENEPLFTVTTGCIAVAIILAVVLTFKFYRKYSEELGEPVKWFRKSFFIDEFYEQAIVSPGKWIAKAISSFVEPTVFEGSVTMTGERVREAALQLRQIQSGQIRSYVAWMVIGVVIIIGVVIWGGHS